MADILALQKLSSQVRRDIVRMVHAVSSGHPGGSLGCTEYLVALYNGVMNHNGLKHYKILVKYGHYLKRINRHFFHPW